MASKDYAWRWKRGSVAHSHYTKESVTFFIALQSNLTFTVHVDKKWF
jgi:hypothetical protein